MIPDFSDQISAIRKEHPSSTHIVYAYRVKEVSRILYEKFSDAGEPSGTAGKPTLNVLQKQEIINGIILTVRYFGGIKLGKGGLVRAYSESAKLALLNAILREFIVYKMIQTTLSYPQFESVEREIQKRNYEITQKEFAEFVTIQIQCREQGLSELKVYLSEIGIQSYDIMD